MKHLVRKEITKQIDFMDDTIEIRKLSVAGVKDLQKEIRDNAKFKEDSELRNIRSVIKAAVVGAEAMSSEELDSFPLDELAKLTNNILEYCGLSGRSEQEEGN